jgi:hypothetical protein
VSPLRPFVPTDPANDAGHVDSRPQRGDQQATQHRRYSTSTVPTGRAVSSDGDDVQRRHRLHSLPAHDDNTIKRRGDWTPWCYVATRRRTTTNSSFVVFIIQVSPLSCSLLAHTRTRCHVAAVGDVATE